MESCWVIKLTIFLKVSQSSTPGLTWQVPKGVSSTQFQSSVAISYTCGVLVSRLLRGSKHCVVCYVSNKDSVLLDLIIRALLYPRMLFSTQFCGGV